MNVLLLLFFAASALFAPAALASRRNKLRYSNKVAVVATEMKGMNCHLDVNRKHLMQLSDGTQICRYRGKWHDIAAKWFDTSRCLQCLCIPPFGTKCCQVRLKPVNMPKRCKVDTQPWSKLPRLASCMAAIVSVKSRKKVCKSRRLRESLLHTRWTSVRGHPQYLKAVPAFNVNH